MKTLRHICEEADQQFHVASGKLEELAESWLEDMNIISYTIMPTNKVIIVSEDSDKPGRFSLHRFFPIGNRWEVSVDLDGVKYEKVIDHVLKSYK